MADTTRKTTIDAGEIENITEMVFSAGVDDRRYILQAPGTKEDYLSTLERYMKFQVKRTTDYFIDDSSGRWFACYNVDCFDPPMAIVRARTWEDAYSVFITEFERWMKVDSTDAGDYPEDDRTYNDNATHVDTDNVQIHELRLESVLIGGV
jgi:hypothetical protein